MTRPAKTLSERSARQKARQTDGVVGGAVGVVVAEGDASALR